MSRRWAVRELFVSGAGQLLKYFHLNSISKVTEGIELCNYSLGLFSFLDHYSVICFLFVFKFYTQHLWGT